MIGSSIGSDPRVDTEQEAALHGSCTLMGWVKFKNTRRFEKSMTLTLRRTRLIPFLLAVFTMSAVAVPAFAADLAPAVIGSASPTAARTVPTPVDPILVQPTIPMADWQKLKAALNSDPSLTSTIAVANGTRTYTYTTSSGFRFVLNEPAGSSVWPGATEPLPWRVDGSTSASISIESIKAHSQLEEQSSSAPRSAPSRQLDGSDVWPT